MYYVISETETHCCVIKNGLYQSRRLYEKTQNIAGVNAREKRLAKRDGYEPKRVREILKYSARKGKETTQSKLFASHLPSVKRA